MGGRIYAMGGHDGVRYLNSVEAYDPATNQWTSVATISQCRLLYFNLLIFFSLFHKYSLQKNFLREHISRDNQKHIHNGSLLISSDFRAGAGVAWADCRVDALLRPPSMALGKDSGCAPCVTGVAHCV